MLIHTDDTQNLIVATRAIANKKLAEYNNALVEIEKDWTKVDQQIKEAEERLAHLRNNKKAIVGSHEDTEKAIKQLESLVETLPILLEE